MQSDPRYAANRDTALVRELTDALDESPIALSALEARVTAVLNHEPIRLVEVDQGSDLPETPPLARLLPPARPLEAPVDEVGRAVKDGKAKAFPDGVNGENALHS